MKRILLTIEHGGNFGHAAMVSVLAKMLEADGHEVTVAAPRQELSAEVFRGVAYRLVEAPECRGHGAARPAMPWDSLATMLWDTPLSLPERSSAMFEAWRKIYADVRPDAGVFNYSPLAMLAARHTGMQRIQLGLPNDMPEWRAPLPSLRYWQPLPVNDALRFEAKLVERIGRGMGESFGGETLAELLRPDCSLITSLPELDPYYAAQASRTYVGPVPLPTVGERVAWQGTAQRIKPKRAFAYLRNRFVDVAAIAHELGRHFGEAVIACPDADDKVIAACHKSGLRLLREFSDISELARSCDLMLSHAGGMAANAVIWGVPQLLYPTQFEQFLTSRRLTESRLAVMANPQDKQACIGAIAFASTHDRLHSEVRAASKRYADMAQDPGCRLRSALRAALRD